MQEKKIIYYARAYRHLKADTWKCFLYFLLVVLPCLMALVVGLEKLTTWISNLGARVLGRVFSGIPIYIVEDEFSILGTIKYIDMPSVYPKMSFVLGNILMILVFIFLVGMKKWRGRPLAIFLLLNAVIHLSNCIYFLFASNYFPYNALQFSDLYMKQQIGIWLIFMILIGLITTFIGNKGYFYKTLIFVMTMVYSLIFGVVRYILFLFLLEKYSLLYMALMYFVFGPVMDFLYLVFIYSLLINKMVSLYHSSKGRESWRWS